MIAHRKRSLQMMIKTLQMQLLRLNKKQSSYGNHKSNSSGRRLPRSNSACSISKTNWLLLPPRAQSLAVMAVQSIDNFQRHHPPQARILEHNDNVAHNG